MSGCCGTNEKIISLPQTLTWIEAGTWLSASTDVHNTWLWGATQVMPIFGAQVMNVTLNLRLPPMQLLLNRGLFPVRQRDTHELIVPEDTVVLEDEDLKANGFWTTQNVIKPSTIKCFRNLVVLGHKNLLCGYVTSGHFAWRTE